jgi:ribosomal protein S2
MKKIPDVVFIVDGIYEDQALKEANSLNLVSFAILNTNGDDTVVDNCIPANTNSVKSIDYIV